MLTRGHALLLSALLAAVAFGLLAQPSAAMTTFSGSCDSRAFIENFPGRTLVPVPSGYAFHTVGHCKGTLNGAPFDGPVKMDIYADMKTLMSCEFGYSTEGGPIYYTFLTGGSNAGIPATAHSPSAQASSTARPPSPSGARARAHASRKKGHRRRHHRKKRTRQHGASSTTSSTSAPAPQPVPPPENPVLAMWITEVHTGTTLVNNLFGAYRGYGIATEQFEGSDGTLKECLTDQGNTGLWLHGSMHTVTEMRG